MYTKRQIENAGLAGYPLQGSHVLRVKRGSGGRVMVERHAWPESTDGRIRSAVQRAARRYAQETANRLGRMVEIYSHSGDLLLQVDPS